MKLGLDIDGVLADFVSGVILRARRMGMGEHFPATAQDITQWMFSGKFSEVMKEAWDEPRFWLSLPPLYHSLPPVPAPDCYITSRPIPTRVTERWLAMWEFPEAKVITVSKPEDKLAHVLERGLDVFVDDYYPTVRQLRDAGVNAILFEAPYQVGHQEEIAGLPKIKTLSELSNWPLPVRVAKEVV